VVFGGTWRTLVGVAKSQPSPRPRRRRATDDPAAERPVLPAASRDELDIGWGDDESRRDEEWYRRERPPHHE
jgi:hypothetical protein